MAFYNPPFYHTELTHYNSYDSYDSFDSYHDSYDSYHDSAQIEPPISQSSNEPTFYNLFDYPPPCYFGQGYDSGVGYLPNSPYRSNFNESPQLIEYEPVDHAPYGYSISYSANACSASTYSVPKVIEYDPAFYGDDYQKVSTQFVISYSVSEFNETEFEEYDPTPYGGGYDISETYGKPLPPSIEICYPPSSSSPPKPPPPSATAIIISKGPIEEAPKGKIEEQTKPTSEIKPTQIEKDNDSSSSESDTASESEEIEEIKAIPIADPGIGYENGRELNQFPSGCGLEAMDLCETLFGYWPCLSRAKRQTACRQANNGCGRCHGHCHCYGNYYSNQWQTAADYLFGSHNPYPDERSSQGDAVYGYQRQHQEEPVYGYVWLNGFNRSEDD